MTQGVLWMMIGGTMQGNYANTTHPEWMMISPENFNGADTQTPGKNMYGLDLSDPKCVEWLVDWVGDTMVEFNYDVFRHEMGMDYAHGPMWGWKDATLQPTGLRKGITETKYIEGLLAFWDGVRAAKPGAVVDGCSGGGRNIDLETISRGIWKWRSDFQNPLGNFRSCKPPCANGSAVADIHQSMTMGLAHYNPMNAHFSFYATGYAWRSVVTTGLVLAWDVRNDTVAEQHTLALATAETLRLRKYTVAGDIWWLTPQTLDPTSWAAWQTHVPHVGGTAVYFRRNRATSGSMKSGLRGISNSSAAAVGETLACYSVQAYDEHYALVLNKTMSATALSAYEVALPQPSTSMLLEYKSVGGGSC